MVTVRIGRTDVTWPNVRELTFVSTDAHCTVFSRLSGVDLQRERAIAAQPQIALEQPVELPCCRAR